jgi:tRNA-modifying protein YgfZ
MSGYEALRSAAAWIDLSTRGKIRASGEDRARLLHSMCTNHVAGLEAGDGLYAFFLTSQGRILADAYVYNLDETLLLDTEPETSQKLLAHLDKYIIADDVTLEDETAQWACIGLEGPASSETGAALGISMPKKDYCLRPWQNGFVVYVASAAKSGLRIFVPQAEKTHLLETIEALGVPNATAEEARIVRLENGKPRYGEDITERYLVQETQAMHAVHLNKGCYLGQEIVERVRSRGQIHRLLTPFRIKDATLPPPKTKLLWEGKEVAEVSSAAFSPALGEIVGLAYVRTEVARQSPILVVAGSEPVVTAYIPNLS